MTLPVQTPSTPTTPQARLVAAQEWLRARGAYVLEATGRRQWRRDFRAPAPPVPARRRSFDGGTAGRLTAAWSASRLHINRMLRGNLLVMRGRSRDLARNDPYVTKFLRMVETNVIGAQGIGLQVRTQWLNADGTSRPDESANRILETGWARWNARGSVEVTGMMDGPAFDRLYVRMLARDGEVLIRPIRDARLPYGFQLQFLDPDWLDESFHQEATDGTRVVMGVHIDPAGRRLGYWLRNRHPGDTAARGPAAGERRYVPAADLWHDFVQTDPEQVRGIPWLHAAMGRLYQLGEFDEAALLAARIGASKVGFYESPDGDPDPLASGIAGEGLEAVPQQDLQAGEFAVLPPGYKFTSWDPNYPNDVYADFVKGALRGIASGLGVAYNTLGNDLEGVNFSSIRAGTLEERDAWRVVQGFITSGWKSWQYGEWLRAALLCRAQPLAPLAASRFDKYNVPDWMPRSWDWVDPLKDVEAKAAELAQGLTSRRRILAEKGLDFDTVIAELAAEEQAAQAAGVTLGGAQKVTNPAAPVDTTAGTSAP